MSLGELIRAVENREKTVTVVNADDGVAETLEARFADRNVAVERDERDAGPDGYAVVSESEKFLDAVNVSAVRESDEKRQSPLDGEVYEPVLDYVDETLFASYDVDEMVAASREIEDRAWRAGAGRLYAGFQRLSVFADQRGVYEQLGGKEALDVHAFAYPDEPLPEPPERVAVHAERAPEVRETWFVAYDGDGVDTEKCVLLAEERDPGEFYGFWSYDPGTVEEVFDHLERTYRSDDDGSGRRADAGTDAGGR